MPGLKRIASWFTRGVAVVLGLTFISLWWQSPWLMGPEGLSPVVDSLRPGLPWMRHPSLLWWSPEIWCVHLVHALGVASCVLMFAGRWRRISVVGAGAAYLSLIHAGGPFFQFQWDNLVVETLWICLLLPNDARDEPHPVVGLAFRWLLFRMYLESGVRTRGAFATDCGWSGPSEPRHHCAAPLDILNPRA